MKQIERIEKFLSLNGEFNIEELMAEFLISYAKAIDYITELYREGKIKQTCDFSFKYIEKSITATPENEEVEEDLIDEDDDELFLDEEFEENDDDETELNEEYEDIETKKREVLVDLLTRKYEYNTNNTEEFENSCMDVIEAAIISPNWTKQDAIILIEELLEQARNSVNEKTLKIFERVKYEFGIATENEFNLLREQIFKKI